MTANIDNLLSVNRHIFTSWQDADLFVINKIFDFNAETGHKDYYEIISSIFNSKQTINNRYLSNMSFNCSYEVNLLESIVDNYIQSGLINHDPQSMRGTSPTNEVDNCIQAHQAMIYLISLSSIRLFDKLTKIDPFKQSLSTTLDKLEIAKTVAKKQSDYGSSNICKFGLYGIVVRMHDKIGRVHNLLEKSALNQVKSETIFDTILDLIGYSTIMYLWINDWFLLPMSSDYRWEETAN